MTKINFLYFTVLISFLFLISCKDTKEVKPETQKKNSFSIYASTRTEEDDNNDVVTSSNGITDILEDEFIDGFSQIYISQRGNNLDPSFEDLESDNLYTYSYYENPAASWESGYNFAPVGNKELDWKNIQNIGQMSNGYVFFSLYFPQDNKVRFKVEQDQSFLDNLRKSNVLGARHTTDKIDSRLRFRFYHLMAFLNVYLYVPVYHESDNSGFLNNALEEGDVLNINPYFRINYSGDAGADQAPSVEIIQDSPLENVMMYLHPVSEVTSINVRDFYPASEIKTDEVRKYTLSVLFPAQNIQQGDFLRFQLHTPGGTIKKYLFSTNTQSISLQIEKGKVAQLGLYLPRNDNKTVVVNAEILEWNNSSSEMNVVEETIYNN